MKRNGTFALFAALSGVMVGLVTLVVLSYDKTSANNGASGVAAHKPASPTPLNSTGEKSRVAGIRQAWLDAKAMPGTFTKERQNLAQRSVDELLCGSELVGLMEFLRQNGIVGLEDIFDVALSNLFTSSRAAEACDALAKLPEVEPFKTYCLKWSFLAGKVLTGAHRKALLEQLKWPASVQNVVLGASLSQVTTEPVAALTVSINQLKHKLHTIEGSNILTVLTSTLPFNADFEGLEQALSIPATDLSKDISGSLMTARHNVFRTWAAQDPAAAANYILNNADRIEPALMATVIEAVVQKDASAGVEWLQNLPDGPFLDQAINYTIAHIAQTDVGYEPAKELAGLISDATLREERLAWIEARRAQHR